MQKDTSMKLINKNNPSVTESVTGKGNRIEFTVKGNNSPASFTVTVADSAGRTKLYSPKGGNFDFVFTDYRKRRVIIDFEGDRPENDGGCDLSDVKAVTYTLIDDPEGDVYVGDAEIVTKRSYSAEWDKRRKEIAGSYAMTQNEVNPKVHLVNDIEELKALREKLHRENGEFDSDFIRARGDRFVHSDGRPFTPVGANYLGLNIWEPNIIRYFSPEEIDEDFSIMEKLGYTIIRFAFTHYIVPDENDCDRVSEESLLKIAVYLELARKHHLRVILVGLDGKTPEKFASADTRVNEGYLTMMEKRFSHAAEYFKDDPTIFAWNIYNELTVGTKTPEMLSLWEENKAEFPDYQLFKVEVGNRLIKRLTDAVRRGSQNHMVTCGTLQWSFPMIRPDDEGAFPGVDPHGFIDYVDFLCPHYYPIYASHIFYPPVNFHRNLQALRGWVNYCKLGKPIVLEEFGCPGGGDFWGFDYTQNHQLMFMRAAIDTLAADVAGFVCWPFQDVPGSTDISMWCGVIDVEKNTKQAGAEFAALVNTADRTKRPEEVYPLDLASCVHEKSDGFFSGYIHTTLDRYIDHLKNRENDVRITRN
mgnify:CR=1 FL=1